MVGIVCVLDVICCEVGVEVGLVAAVLLCWLVKELSSESIAFSCREQASHTRTLSSYAEGAI